MSSTLVIIAFVALSLSMIFCFAGVMAMMDFEPPASNRGRLLLLLDIFVTDGFFHIVRNLRRNWGVRTYERGILLTGIAFGALAVVLGSVAVLLSD